MFIRIRPEAPSDFAAIARVTVDAFRTAEHSTGTEQFIIRALRESGQLAVSLVAESDGIVVGHAAASPVTISSGAPGWYGLGPVSVQPARQRQGIGAELVRHVLSALQAAGAAGCVVLGEPRYYARFGFRPEPSLSLPGVPGGYFQTLAFRGTLPAGSVAYHDAFSARG